MNKMVDTSSGYPCFHCPQIFPQQSGLASHVLSKHMGCKEEEISLDESSHITEDQESDERSIHNSATESPPVMSALKDECSDSMGDKDDQSEDTKVFVVNEVKDIHEYKVSTLSEKAADYLTCLCLHCHLYS